MALIDRLKTTNLSKMRGSKPTAPLTLAGDPLPVNNTFSKGEYSEYILGTEKKIDAARAKDSTAFSGGASGR
jgi:hypothetical protein